MFISFVVKFASIRRLLRVRFEYTPTVFLWNCCMRVFHYFSHQQRSVQL